MNNFVQESDITDSYAYKSMIKNLGEGEEMKGEQRQMANKGTPISIIFSNAERGMRENECKDTHLTKISQLAWFKYFFSK